MKKKLIAVILAISMLATCACSIPNFDGDSDELVMATGGTGGTYFAVGDEMASTLNPVLSKSSLTILSTGGSVANIELLRSEQAQLAFVQNDIISYAYNGIELFEESGKFNDFSALAGLYDETIQIVTCNKDIKTPEDLKGKRVCVGEVDSGTEINAREILGAYNMTFDDIEAVNASFKDASEKLDKGDLDAAFLVAGAPTKAVTELAEKKDIYMIGLDNSHIKKLLSEYDFFRTSTIDSGTYPNVDADTSTLSVRAVLVASNLISSDKVYELLTRLYEKQEQLSQGHEVFDALTTSDVIKDISIPLHPGAKKYYKEQGLLED